MPKISKYCIIGLIEGEETTDVQYKSLFEEILKKYNVEYYNFKFYIELLCKNGCGWNNKGYIPIEVFSSEKEMNYFFSSIINGEHFADIFSNLINGTY